MLTEDFDFHLPEDLIAKKPAEKRDESNLLVLHRDGKIELRKFHDLAEYLNKGDMLLLNNTMVFPARLIGTKPSGGKVEILLVKEIRTDVWEILSTKKYNGILSIAKGLSVEIKEGVARFSYSGDFMECLWRHGNMPLPPYIKRKPDLMDKERYQTVYAENEGSIAAPTAGIHFTRDLIDRLNDKGVLIRYLTLHVGIGTFKPIRTEEIEDHSMEPEYFEMHKDLISEIREVRASNKRVVSVGTTTTRAIEGYMSGKFVETEKRRSGEAENSPIHPFTHSPVHSISGYTNIFIYPGYEFRAIDSLVTNFHLPRSTPLMLTSALCGFKKLMAAYDMAKATKYRFFSYGDAMLIL